MHFLGGPRDPRDPALGVMGVTGAAVFRVKPLYTRTQINCTQQGTETLPSVY